MREWLEQSFNQGGNGLYGLDVVRTCWYMVSPARDGVSATDIARVVRD